MVGTRTWDPCGKILHTEIDHEDPTSSLDQVYWGMPGGPDQNEVVQKVSNDEGS